MNIKSSTPSNLCLFVLMVYMKNIEGHGGMLNPSPRAIISMNYPADSKAGWPLTMRESCLTMRSYSPIRMKPGKTTIQLRANDGANHIGPCTMYLVDPTNSSNNKKIAEKNNCMDPNNQKGIPGTVVDNTWDISIPEKALPCEPKHCILHFVWKAVHVSPPEFYDSCADIQLDIASSSRPSVSPAPTVTPAPDITTTPIKSTHAPMPRTTALPVTKSLRKTQVPKDGRTKKIPPLQIPKVTTGASNISPVPSAHCR